jgi:spore germination protein (amino acid permease)
LTKNNKISVRQIFIMFIVITLSPTIRVFPTSCAQFGKTAAWVGPIIATACLVLLTCVLTAIFKSGKFRDLGDVFEKLTGKVVSKVLLTLYLLWATLLFLLYIRYYAERPMSTIFPYVNIRYFIVSMMILVFIAAHGRLEAFARLAEIAFIIFIVTFLIFFVFLIPTIKPRNMLPVTYLDAFPALKSAFPVVSIFGYLTPFFFLGAQISDKEKLFLKSKKLVIFLFIISTMTVVCVVGSLGYRTTGRMPMPFFSAMKLVNVLQSFDRLETAVLAIWVVADFILIVAFALIIVNILKSLFRVTEPKHYATPVVFLGYIGGIYLAVGRFELEAYSSSILCYTLNTVFGFGVPLALLGIGKLRKLL